MALACGRGRPIASPAGSSSSQVAASRGMPPRSLSFARTSSACPTRSGASEIHGQDAELVGGRRPISSDRRGLARWIRRGQAKLDP